MKYIKKKLKGNALILTMFIMAGMIIVASSGSYLAIIAIRSGSIQAQSTKAYFIAESGAERLLYELRKGIYSPESTPDHSVPIFQNQTGDLESDGNYEVYHTEDYNLIWLSTGEYNNTKRGVEIEV